MRILGRYRPATWHGRSVKKAPAAPRASRLRPLVILSTLKRPSSTQTLWQEIKTVQEVRNGVVHRGETVGEEVAKQSIEIADMLLNVVFPDVLSKLDLHTHPPIRICNKAHQKPPSSTPQS